MEINIFMRADRKDILNDIINLYGRENVEISIIDNRFYYVKIKGVTEER